MADWTVEYTKEVEQQIAEQYQVGLIDNEDINSIRTWVETIERLGLSAVQTNKWNDHPLTAEWAGYRSAAFSNAGRIIYRVEGNKLIVYVVRVTATHDYRR